MGSFKAVSSPVEQAKGLVRQAQPRNEADTDLKGGHLWYSAKLVSFVCQQVRCNS